MAKMKVFRDPVHANIEFDRTLGPDALALELIGTREVQRLRHVRQLALASNVYHGAEHSRFSHTLGVTHLARKMYRAACLNSDRKPGEIELAVVTASAVLHDIGHPPFSHAVESILGVDHEELTVRQIKGDTQIHELLVSDGGKDFVQEVASHVLGESDAPTSAIISSQLDADRMDYVLRDGYHAGVPNSRFDLERILQLVQCDDIGLLYDDRAVMAIEGYFIARYHLYLQLYYHRTNRAGEVMLRSVLKRAKHLADTNRELGVDDEIAQLFSESAADAALRITDHDIWFALRLWQQHDDAVLADLSRRLLQRDLFKSLEMPTASLGDFYEIKPTIDELADARGFDPDYYVKVDATADKPYKISDSTAGSDEQISIRMINDGGKRYSLERGSGLIKKLEEEAYSMHRLCVPAEIRDEVKKILP